MNRPLPIFLLTALVAGAVAAAPARKPVKKPVRTPGPDLPSRLPPTAPVVKVNGVAVPLSQYVDALSLRFGPEVRESLVGEEILRQECARRKITASGREKEAVVARAFQDSVQRAGSEKRLAEELVQTRGWSVADYKAVLRSQAGLQVFREKLAAQLVPAGAITPEDLEKAYAEERDRFAQPDSVRIAHILVRRPEAGASDRETLDRTARLRAESLLKRVKDGAAFDALARTESDDKATGERGGAVPTDIVRGANPFGAAFEAAVYSAEVGLIPEVIASPLGFHVVRLESKRDARTLPLAEVSAGLRNALLAQRRNREMQELFARLRAKAKVDTGKF